ncbi:MAG: nucleotidyltransferase domain-containing protein [Elainellaceae cyanobacterium]
MNEYVGAMRHPSLDAILKQVKSYLSLLYRERLRAVVLYGSQARKDSHDASDIDVLVVLAGAINPYKEISRTSHYVAQVCLEHSVVISCHFISADKFMFDNNPFLQNIRREGIAL